MGCIDTPLMVSSSGQVFSRYVLVQCLKQKASTSAGAFLRWRTREQRGHVKTSTAWGDDCTFCGARWALSVGLVVK